MTDKREVKTKPLNILVPLLCCGIFTALCCINITSSVWFDESYSAFLSRSNFSDIWNLTSLDVHPPLYYIVLKLWTMVFGDSVITMRFMSVFFGAIAIIFAYQLFRKLFNAKAAGLATLFLSVSPMFIRYGQEMRMYTMVIAIIIAATYVLQLMLETKKTKYYILYAILIALGLWTHYFTALAWFVHLIYIKFFSKKSISTKGLVGIYALALVLFLPWIPSLAHHLLVVEGAGFWVPEINLATLPSFISGALLFITDLSLVKTWLAAAILIIAIFTITLAVKVYRGLSKEKQGNFNLVASLVFLPPILLFVFSLPPFTALFIDRYILYSAVLLWAFIGLVIALYIKDIKKQAIKIHSSNNNTKIKINLNPIIFAGILLGTSIAALIIGVSNVEERTPDNYINEMMQEISIFSDSEPIIAADDITFFNSSFYSHDNVYALSSRVEEEYGAHRAINVLHKNVIDDIDDFASVHSTFWYLTPISEDEDIESVEFPVDGRTATSTILIEGYAAFRLEKI